MKILVPAFAALLLLAVAGPAAADKPTWAGDGGQPTEREKARHKEEMTSKHEDKKKDKDKDKDKDKKKKDKQGKGKNGDDKDWDDIEDDVRDKVADEIDKTIRGN